MNTVECAREREREKERTGKEKRGKNTAQS
jgi:hypothetical protein